MVKRGLKRVGCKAMPTVKKTTVIGVSAAISLVVGCIVLFSLQCLHDEVISAASRRNFARFEALARCDIFLSGTGYKIHQTPLMVAVDYNNMGVVHFLLDKNVRLKVQNDYGQTALEIARASPYRQKIASLLQTKLAQQSASGSKPPSNSRLYGTGWRNVN